MIATHRIALGLLLITCSLTSCKNENKLILIDRGFNEGKWLLVVKNYAEKTLFIVDDETVLRSNPDGIKLGPFAECGGTTCDGFIELYKDGNLVAAQEYLSKSDLIESDNLKRAYKRASADCINPKDNVDFKRQWDSLAATMNIYPTRKHIQPEDKDVICFYKYE
jgi:hypothetical protein